MGQFRVDDESGDKKYFTMVPNYVLNHSGAIEQGLYLQMKRYAGENGSCYASGRTLRKQLKIGIKAYRTALKYLLEHDWVYLKGKQLAHTTGGDQLLDVYGVRDLWKLNSEHYDKGVAKRTPLAQGVAERSKGVAKSSQGVAESAPKKNIIKTQEDTSFKEFKEEMRKKYPTKRL